MYQRAMTVGGGGGEHHDYQYPNPDLPIYANRIQYVKGGITIEDGVCYVKIQYKALTSLDSTYSIFDNPSIVGTAGATGTQCGDVYVKNGGSSNEYAVNKNISSGTNFDFVGSFPATGSLRNYVPYD